MQSCTCAYVQSQHCTSYHNLLVLLFVACLHLNHFMRMGYNSHYHESIVRRVLHFCGFIFLGFHCFSALKTTSHTGPCHYEKIFLLMSIPYSSKFSWHNISWISWLTPRSRIFYSRKFNLSGRGLFTSGACNAFTLTMKPGFDKDTLLASRNPTLQRQCY